MSRITHLSDVHFGAHDPCIVAGAEAWLAEARPDLVVISGDFTQRARVDQYEQACAFVDRIESLGLPVLAVPGNHDVPLYDVVRRFARPLKRYERFISDDLCPWFETEHLAVLGLNTARSLTIKDGRINHEQMALIRTRFADVPDSRTRILVTHHPLIGLPIGEAGALTEAVGRHEDALDAVTEAGVHILLAGHFHRTFADAANRMAERVRGALVIQAGTATSTRIRADEPQSFNLLHVHGNQRVDLRVFAWNGSAFEGADAVRYRFADDGWTRHALANAQVE